MPDRPRLQEGDRVWHVDGVLVYVREVVKVKPYIDDQGKEMFVFYDIKAYSDRIHESVHPYDLYKAPEQREALIKVLESHAKSFKEMALELKCQENDHIPEIGDDI